MKFRLLIWLGLLYLQTTQAQERPSFFKLLVITPDSASVDSEIALQFELMALDFQHGVMKESAKEADQVKVTKSKALKSRLEWQFEVTENIYQKIKNIKFYHMVSKFGSLRISEKTNLGPSHIAEVTLDKGKKRLLYDSLPLDDSWQYLMKYTGLSAKKFSSEILFSGTVTLIDLHKNQIVLEKEFTGSSNDKSDWPCFSLAECSLNSFVKISSDAVVVAISIDR